MASHHFLKCPGTRRCLNGTVITPQRKTTRDDSQPGKWQRWQRELFGAPFSQTMFLVAFLYCFFLTTKRNKLGNDYVNQDLVDEVKEKKKHKETVTEIVTALHKSRVYYKLPD